MRIDLVWKPKVHMDVQQIMLWNLRIAICMTGWQILLCHGCLPQKDNVTPATTTTTAKITSPITTTVLTTPRTSHTPQYNMTNVSGQRAYESSQRMIVYIVCGVIGFMVIIGILLVILLLYMRKNGSYVVNVSEEKGPTENSDTDNTRHLSEKMAANRSPLLTTRRNGSYQNISVETSLPQPNKKMAFKGSPLLTGQRTGPYENVVIETSFSKRGDNISTYKDRSATCSNNGLSIDDVNTPSDMYSQVGQTSKTQTARNSMCDSTEMVDNVLYD